LIKSHDVFASFPLAAIDSNYPAQKDAEDKWRDGVGKKRKKAEKREAKYAGRQKSWMGLVGQRKGAGRAGGPKKTGFGEI